MQEEGQALEVGDLQAEINAVAQEEGFSMETPAANDGLAVVDNGNGEEEYFTLLRDVLGLGFGVLAPAWGVSPEEVEALAGAYAPLLQKYFPDGVSGSAVELTAAIATVGIIGRRLGTPRTVEGKEIKEQAKSTGGNVQTKAAPVSEIQVKADLRAVDSGEGVE